MCGKALKQVIIAICLLLGLLFCCSLQVSADGGVMNRAESKQTIMISMKQLKKLKKELEETQVSLTNANQSLNGVRNDLTESRTSLEELKNKIKKMEHKQAVIRRQRDLYAGLFIITVGTVIARR